MTGLSWGLTGAGRLSGSSCVYAEVRVAWGHLQPLTSAPFPCLGDAIVPPPCRYAYTLGLAGGVITNGFPVALRLNETTIADKLKVLGYQTHGFGKWDSKHRCDTPYSLI